MSFEQNGKCLISIVDERAFEIEFYSLYYPTIKLQFEIIRSL